MFINLGIKKLSDDLPKFDIIFGGLKITWEERTLEYSRLTKDNFYERLT